MQDFAGVFLEFKSMKKFREHIVNEYVFVCLLRLTLVIEKDGLLFAR